jgi:hypothetical protein
MLDKMEERSLFSSADKNIFNLEPKKGNWKERKEEMEFLLELNCLEDIIR